MREGFRAHGFAVACALSLCAGAIAAPDDRSPPEEETVITESSPSRLSDEPLPLLVDEVPERPSPLLELGAPFLGTGAIGPGMELPTGAVWQPSLLLFGTLRSALQTFDDGETTVSEWANRLDLFGNLKLSGTERVVVGVRPLEDGRRGTGYVFSPADEDGWDEEFNLRLETLFFEGDLGELFPYLNSSTSAALDIGFSVGRQPVFYQEGILIDDTFDAIGVTCNNMAPPGFANLQMTFLYGWGDIHRDNNREDASAHLFGLFSEADLHATTVNLDVAYVYDEDEETDALFAAASAVQRLGPLNSALRVLTSVPFHDERPAASRGTLIFAELSWTPPRTDDLLYLDAFWGIDEFSSAARARDAGGPLGRTGILFAAVGLGNYGAALGNRADRSAGGSVGYQKFFAERRQQVVVEVGGRTLTEDDSDPAAAVGGRCQIALGRHVVARVDVFGAKQESRDLAGGARLEFGIKF